MTKRYDEPIEIEATPQNGAPGGFSWRGRRYAVEQPLGSWLEGGEWWDASRRRDREYHRLLARPARPLVTGDVDPDGFLMGPPLAVYDIYRDRTKDEWRLARVWD